jgi:hypothetical protein
MVLSQLRDTQASRRRARLLGAALAAVGPLAGAVNTTCGTLTTPSITDPATYRDGSGDLHFTFDIANASAYLSGGANDPNGYGTTCLYLANTNSTALIDGIGPGTSGNAWVEEQDTDVTHQLGSVLDTSTTPSQWYVTIYIALNNNSDQSAYVGDIIFYQP